MNAFPLSTASAESSPAAAGDRCVHDVVLAWAAATPDAVAVRGEGRADALLERARADPPLEHREDRAALVVGDGIERVGRGESNASIKQSLVQEYGESVLAAPPASGFNWFAYAFPAVAFAIGLGLVIMIIRQWRHRVIPAPAAGPAAALAPR